MKSNLSLEESIDYLKKIVDERKMSVLWDLCDLSIINLIKEFGKIEIAKDIYETVEGTSEINNALTQCIELLPVKFLHEIKLLESSDDESLLKLLYSLISITDNYFVERFIQIGVMKEDSFTIYNSEAHIELAERIGLNIKVIKSNNTILASILPYSSIDEIFKVVSKYTYNPSDKDEYSESFKRNFSDIMKLVDQKKLRDAIALTNSIIKNLFYTEINLEEEMAIIRYQRGCIKFDIGNYLSAKKDFSESIFKLPERMKARAYFNLGRSNYELGLYDNAIQDCNNGLSFNSQDADLYYIRGFSFYANQKWDNALFDFENVLKLSPNYPDKNIVPMIIHLRNKR